MLQEITQVVRECGEIIKTAQIHHVELKNQDRKNLVTEYDVKVQALLKEKLTKIVPGAAFLGEEGESHYRKDGYCFVCDPIDGTTNFVKGFNYSSTSVALLRDGQPILGVIYNPYADEMFCAEKGKGATLNGQPIHTTKEALANSLVIFGTGIADPSQVDYAFDYAKKCFRASVGVRRCGSAALDLCSVACGRVAYFYEFKLCPWDYSAGALILEEAGGLVKTQDFKDVDDYFQNRTIFALASEGVLKDVLAL